MRHFLEKEKLLCCESLPSPHQKDREGKGMEEIFSTSSTACVCVCVVGGEGCVSMGQCGELEIIPYILEINSQKKVNIADSILLLPPII